MKRIALLCGLLSILYIPLQAQAEEDGYYSKVLCRGVENSCVARGDYGASCLTGSIMGFGYGTSPSHANANALDDCKARMSSNHTYTETGGFPRYDANWVLHGHDGQWICAESGYVPTLGATVEEAHSILDHNLNEIHQAGYSVSGKISCYHSVDKAFKSFDHP